MPAWLAAIVSFETANWQGQLALALTQLPSIIVALTDFPKTDDALKTLLQVLNMLSLLAHRDSPGTLKAPFTLSRPPPVVTVALPQPVPGSVRA